MTRRQQPGHPIYGLPKIIAAALFGHVIRRGRLRLGGWTIGASMLADLDLDLRQAEIDSERSTVTTLVAFGNVDVYVPEGVNVDVRGLTDNAVRTLVAYDYPGNVRELENILERAFIRLKIRGADLVDVEDLPLDLRSVAPGTPHAHALEVPESYDGLRKIERDMVLKALNSTGWNKRRAAQLLGITHQTLYARIAEFGLAPEGAVRVAEAAPDAARTAGSS